MVEECVCIYIYMNMMFRLSSKMLVSIVNVLVCSIVCSMANNTTLKIFRYLGRRIEMFICSGPLNSHESYNVPFPSASRGVNDWIFVCIV